MSKNKHSLPFWNHNAAYYPKIRRATTGCRRILDVGCGDGSLALYLRQTGREIVGIDPDGDCIGRAREKSARAAAHGLSFFACSFSKFPDKEEMFDSVIFAASLHHMEMEEALEKALKLLRPGGMLCIVGLAKPSTALDFLIEGARVIPCIISSKWHAMRSSEQLEIPTSYEFPGMDEVRRTLGRCLPGTKLRQGLYYRYLVFYRKPKRV